MYFFTADEHYNHTKIIQYCHRPFINVIEMNSALIINFNSVVSVKDITIHAGDFGFFKSKSDATEIIKQLNGNHIFIKGSHDRWLPDSTPFIWSKMIGNRFVVVCHYAMRTWERSHYGSWQLFGHSHGTLLPIGKQWDIGVDSNGFCPVSFDRLEYIMSFVSCQRQVEQP